MWFCCLQREVIDLSMYLCIVNYLFIFMLWCILYCIECLVLESWTIIFCKYKRGEKQRWKGRRRLQVDDSQELLSTVLFGTLEKYELANLTLSPIENRRKTETMRRIRWQYLKRCHPIIHFSGLQAPLFTATYLRGVHMLSSIYLFYCFEIHTKCDCRWGWHITWLCRRNIHLFSLWRWLGSLLHFEYALF